MAIVIKALGELSLTKGVAGDGQSFKAFDYIERCTGTACEIADKCDFFKYAKKTGRRGRKKDIRESPQDHQCLFHRQWLFASAGPYLALAEKNCDPFLLQVIGQHIMPLYRNLFKMLKFELSLRAVESTDNKGSVKIHPIYREIREVQKAIIEQCKMSGLYDAAKEAGFFKPPGELDPVDDTESENKYGSKSYAEQLAGKQ